MTRKKLLTLGISLFYISTMVSLVNSEDENIIRFWTNTFRSAKKVRFFTIHGVSLKFRKSIKFFNNITENLQKFTNATILLRTYKFDNRSANENMYYDLSNKNSKLNINIFLIENVNITNLTAEGKSLASWNKNSYVIVLILEDLKNINETQKSIAQRILQEFWTSNGMWNVIVTFLYCNRNNLYFYNPFAKKPCSEWGAVENLNLTTTENVVDKLLGLEYQIVNNLNGYRLNVGIYDNKPQTFKPKKLINENSIYWYSRGFAGMDGTLLATIAKRINFRVEVVDPDPENVFGGRLPNGTFTGYIGELVNGRIDIMMCASFIMQHCDNLCPIEFTASIDADDMCPVVPKAEKYPKGMQIFSAFKPFVWLSIVSSILIISFFWYITLLIETTKYNKLEWCVIVLETYEFFVGTPKKILPKLNSERILFTAVLLVGLIVMGAFTGSLYKSFSQDSYYTDISNLQELDKANLPIGVPVTILADALGNISDKSEPLYMKNLQSKVKVIKFQEAEQIFDRIADNRDISTIARRSYFPSWLTSRIDENGSPKIHLVLDCPRTYHLAYLIPKNSIFRSRFDQLILRIKQAGLSELWKYQGIAEILSEARLRQSRVRRKKTRSKTRFASLKLTDVQSAFYVLIIGIFIAGIIFVGEKKRLKFEIASIIKEKWYDRELLKN